MRLPQIWRGLDKPLLLAVLMLIGFGLLTLYSASYQKLSATGVSYVDKQLACILVGVLLSTVLVALDYHRWLEASYWLYGLNLLLLVLVLEVGLVRGGAQRWITIPGFTIQPSEFVKLTTILALARFLGARPELAKQSWKAVFQASLFLLPPMLLILKQPDLGTAAVLLPVGFCMLVTAGVRLRVLLTLVGTGILMAPIMWFFLADYQRSRLLVFMDPNQDPLGAGYTVIQSKIAIGSGGLLGKGWLSGTQNQLNFLPERHTDFIFSVVGEEWGFLGASLCLGLFAVLMIRGMGLALETRDPYGRLILVGLVTLFVTHVVVNTGMTLGLMPVVGLPLPFLSYGRSWLLTCLVSVGIMLSIGVQRPFYQR